MPANLPKNPGDCSSLSFSREDARDLPIHSEEDRERWRFRGGQFRIDTWCESGFAYGQTEHFGSDDFDSGKLAAPSGQQNASAQFGGVKQVAQFLAYDFE